MNELFDDESSAPWFVVVRAVEAFRSKNAGRYPGHTEADIQGDFPALKAEVDVIMSQLGPDVPQIQDRYIHEMLRFSDSKLHTVSAFLGGVASQEAIKLLIRQYTPLNHTLIYDGIHGKCQVFNV